MLMFQEDMDEYQSILKESGFIALMKKLSGQKYSWQNVQINIAITGRSGTGKSALINALRNMKADDIGAAMIGCVETTKKPTPYRYTENENVIFWDLPGVDTPNFPTKTYLEKIKIEKYDFVLLFSSGRYSENDTWLAKQISAKYPNSNMFFVRTQVDRDVENYQLANYKRIPEAESELCKKIRDDCEANLRRDGIQCAKIFLVNSYRTDVFDFGMLQRMLLEKVSELKRDAMIISLSSVPNDVVSEKIHVFKSRLDLFSLTAAIAAIGTERENGARMELDVLMEEVIMYTKKLGIDDQSLGIYAKKLNKGTQEMHIQLQMQSYAILRTPASFTHFYNQYDTFRPTKFHSIPYFGRMSKVQNYQRQCRMVLEYLLEMCSSETKRVHINLAIWLNEQKKYF